MQRCSGVLLSAHSGHAHQVPLAMKQPEFDSGTLKIAVPTEKRAQSNLIVRVFVLQIAQEHLR